MRGFPCSVWVRLGLDTWEPGALAGLRFLGWPDGRPLMDQENSAVECLGVVRDELLGVMSDAKTE